MSGFDTLLDVLARRAADQPDGEAFRFLTTGDVDGEHEVWTYSELSRRAGGVSARLAGLGVAPGDRALLMYPPGLDFIAGFFGALRAGVIPVPAYPPNPSQKSQLAHLQTIADDCAARAVLWTDVLSFMAEDIRAAAPSLRDCAWLATDLLEPDASCSGGDAEVGTDSIAFIQYTSGSIGSPKGVALTHRQVLATTRAAADNGDREDNVFFGWAPLHHDLGLMSHVILAIYAGRPSIIMSPLAFIQKPFRWLDGMSRFRATETCGPAFALDLCVRKVSDEQIDGLDLSSVRLMAMGGEPIFEGPLRRFEERFKRCGFDPRAYFAAYGLAEALAVSMTPVTEIPVTRRVDRRSLEAGRFVIAGGEGEDSISLVSSGHVAGDQEVWIVDPDTKRRRGPGETGEIWVRGSNVAAGYWSKLSGAGPGAAFEGFVEPSGEGPFLRTGDIGVLDGPDLFVTGRLKELVILRGRNLYPLDVETTVEACDPALRPGCSVVFADVDRDQERLVVCAEIDERKELDESALVKKIRGAVAVHHGAEAQVVLLLPRGTLAKTPSGKKRRLACARAFREGAFGAHPRHDRASLEARREAPPCAGAPDREVVDWLRAWIAGAVGIADSEVPVDLPFADLGLDSKRIVELTGALAEHVGRSVEPTAAFDHPTVRALAASVAVASGAERRGTVPGRSASVGGAAVAVVGMACRWPGGVDSPAAYWDMLLAGRNAISDPPADRPWLASGPSSEEGGAWPRVAGFVDEVDRFDAAFFGISPREARSMDPQQRMLLEVTHAAFESAGTPVDRLIGSRTGVFIGISSSDYRDLIPFEARRADPYFGSGNSASVAAGRISYVFGLNGPALAVDTACSSSLVAVHEACRSLRSGESDLAVAGGVNLILSTSGTEYAWRAGILSPDGRCKAFDDAADGYVRSEGCGIVVLKRLQEAIDAGDEILATIRGTAINHDGRSNGLTAPSGSAQRTVMRDALRDAAIEPADVSFVEAHGTGTSLGDRIEIHSISSVYAAGRPAGRPLVVGAVKSNIGHAEAAAGMAGLLKTILMLRHRAVPANLHFETPNRHVAWADLPVRIADAPGPWPGGSERPALAAVSSFGLSGTNAHVIVEEARTQPRDPVESDAPSPPERSHHLLTLSAKTGPALQRQAGCVARFLSAPAAPDLPDVAYSLATTRSAFAHRLAIVGPDASRVSKALEAFAESGLAAPGTTRLEAAPLPPSVAFLFTGQGSQYPGMGRGLYESQPVYREALDRCAAIADAWLEKPLLEMLLSDDADASGIDQTASTQPALFALEYALYRLLNEWGIEPTHVLGHSVGEFVAACVSGVFSLEDGLRLVAARGRLMQALPAGGAMVSIEAGEDRVLRAIEPYEAIVSIAAVNGPTQTVVSGDGAAVRAISEAFSRDGVRTISLSVSHAFHSPLMRPMLDEFRAVAESVAYHAPSARPVLVSNVRGALADASVASADYWVEHVEAAVRFADGLEAVREGGATRFVEIGPNPVLCGMGAACVSDEGVEWIPCLREGRDDTATLFEAVARLWCSGVPVDWARFDAPWSRRRSEVPPYAFERQRHWTDEASVAEPSGALTEASEDAFWQAVARGDGDAVASLLSSRSRLSEAARASLPELVEALSAYRGAAISQGRIQGYLHALEWRRTSRPSSDRRRADAAGRWLIFSNGSPLAALCGDALEAAGGDVTQLLDSRASLDLTSATRVVDASDESALSSVLGELNGSLGFRGVVCAWEPESAAAAADEGGAVGAPLVAVANLLRGVASWEVAPREGCWILTRGAVSVGSGDPIPAPWSEAIWALARSFSLEHPRCWGGAVDLSWAPGEKERDELLASILHGDLEDHVALRGSERWIQRIVPYDHRSEAPAREWTTSGTVLVTGGLGALGLHVARWLASRGVPHLVLASRRGESTPGAAAAVAGLREMGVRATVASVDVADRASLEALLAGIAADGERLSAIFHVAGAGDATPFSELDADRIEAVARAKTSGAWLLHESTRDTPLDAFVLFSSFASALGSGRQAGYAAANGYLDGLCRLRRQSGLTAHCVNWGPWSGGGLVTREAADWLKVRGLEPLEPDDATSVLELLLSRPDDRVVVAAVDWPRFRLSYEASRVRRLVSELPGATETTVEGDRPAHAFAASLAALPPDQREARVRTVLRARVAAVLGAASPGDIPLETGFADLGMDSLMALELRRGVEQETGVRLEATAAFDHPTVSALAAHMLSRLGVSGDGGDDTGSTVGSALSAMEQKMVEFGAALLDQADSPGDWQQVYEIDAFPTAMWMNWGFADPPAAGSPPLEAPGPRGFSVADRLSMRLCHEVAAGTDFTGARVLEVGCGRGGNAAYLSLALGAREVVGLDRSAGHVAMARGLHDAQGLSFLEGDAMDLPFEDGEFDVVFNLESAHCYPSYSGFLEEVRRVLRPGGRLLFADLFFAPDDRVAFERAVEVTGFATEDRVDITRNVVCSRDVFTPLFSELTERLPEDERRALHEFVGASGSRTYRRCAEGEARYVRYVLRVPGEPLPGEPSAGRRHASTRGCSAESFAEAARLFGSLHRAPEPVASTPAARRDTRIAIVGMSCRYPGGASGPDEFWRLLSAGTDAVSSVPASRWDVEAYFDPRPATPGKTYARCAAFIDDPYAFDAGFFGISSNEAIAMDPQHRLLLEETWLALENARILPADLRGSRTGVFVGLSSQEYASLSAQPSRLSAYAALGTVASTAAGRVSHVLGLQGPSLVVDTACSSSLVSVHLACQSLLTGESDLALAGGVALMLSPSGFVGASQLGALSRDGRCKSFSSKADGYGRGEGCGIVVLKRLSDAERDGDEILAVVRGSAVAHDGASSALSVPNGTSQRKVIRSALASAGLSPGAVSYVECHGTGTSLGDPIEVAALGDVYGAEREAARPLLIGTAKTNVGHLEAAAGVAGLMKVVLSLQRESIPASLHLDEPNPYIDWDRCNVEVATELRTWPSDGHPRVAGVSSFGISGTNAHVLVEEAPRRRSYEAPAADPEVTPSARHLLTLSAKTGPALVRQAAEYARWLAAEGRSYGLPDIAATAARARTRHDHRLFVHGETHEAMAGSLREFVDTGTSEFVETGRADSGTDPRIVFVYPGQGGQWAGMGRVLLEAEPVFRSAIEDCESVLADEVPWSLTAVLSRPEAAWTSDAEVLQPALFAMSVGLTAVWRKYGVEPDVVVGHSLGEVAAAYVAGALTLEDALRVVRVRSQLARLHASGEGAMAMVSLAVEALAPYLEAQRRTVGLAAVNGPTTCLIAGDVPGVDATLSLLEADGVFCRRVRIDYASHSPQMDPLLPALREQLAGLTPRAGRIPIQSTVSGVSLSGEEMGASYWADNLRAPVLFHEAITALLKDGPVHFVEVGPHPLLSTELAATAASVSAIDSCVATSSRRGADPLAEILGNLGRLHVRGVGIDLGERASRAPRRIPLPVYAFDRQRYRIETTAGPSRRERAPGDTLLGARISSPLESHQFEAVLSYADLPGFDAAGGRGGCALSLALALEAARAFRPGRSVVVAEARQTDALLIGKDETKRIQTVVTSLEDGNALVRVHVAEPSDGSGEVWIVALEAILEFDRPAPTAGPSPIFDAEPPTSLWRSVSTRAIRVGVLEAEEGWWARVAIHEAGEPLDTPVPPAWLRSLAQVAAEVRAGERLAGTPILTGWSRVWLGDPIATDEVVAWLSRVDSPGDGQGAVCFDAILVDLDGKVVGAFERVRAERVSDAEALRSGEAITSRRDLDRRELDAAVQEALASTTTPAIARMGADEDLLAAGLDSLMLTAFHSEITYRLGFRPLTPLWSVKDDRTTLTRNEILAWLGATQAVAVASAERRDGSAPRAATRAEVLEGRYVDLFTRTSPSATLWRDADGFAWETVSVGHGDRLTVLLPPFGCEISVWIPTMERLSESRTALAVNFPGYGRSAARSESTRVTDLARGVRALLEAISPDQPVDLVGWSLGGFVAQTLASTAPDRVRRLTLVNTTDHLAIEGGTPADTEVLMVRMQTDLRRGLASSAPDVAEAIERLVYEGRASRSVLTSAHAAQYISSFDHRGAGRKITAPTCIVAGEQDLPVPTFHARRMARTIPGARLVVLPGVGHYVPMFRTNAFFDVLIEHVDADEE